MALSRCEFCGNAFNSFGSRMCAECTKALDETYLKVRKFIYQNPDKANFTMIVEHTEVSEKELTYLIKSGKINIDSKMGIGNRCRACGTETSAGQLCEQCRIKVLTESMKVKKEPEIQKKKPDVLPISFNK